MSSTPNTTERPSLATPRSSRGPKHLGWKLRLGLTVLTTLLRAYVGLVKLTSRVDASELEAVWSSQ